MINQQAYESALKACGWEEEPWKAYQLVEEYVKADKQGVVEPLPELPEKWTNLEGMQANSTIRSIMGLQNQLIDCVKALYKEQSVNKRIN